jgi:hypothetical protein
MKMQSGNCKNLRYPAIFTKMIRKLKTPYAMILAGGRPAGLSDA